jgi:hypothetical protein
MAAVYAAGTVPRHLVQATSVLGSGHAGASSHQSVVDDFLANPPEFLKNIAAVPEVQEKPWVRAAALAAGQVPVSGAQAVPRHLRQSGANVLGSCSSFEAARIQEEDRSRAAAQAQQMQAQAARSTPLYPGIQGSTSPSRAQQQRQQQQYQQFSPTSTRSRTPLPAPSSQHRSPSRSSSSFGSPSGSSPSFLSKSLTSPIGNRRAPRSFAYGHLPAGGSPTAVYDPSLPHPTVVVHQATPGNAQKNVQERKHRGVSRNVLGGYYTS